MAKASTYLAAIEAAPHFSQEELDSEVKAISGYNTQELFWAYLGSSVKFACVNSYESFCKWLAYERSVGDLKEEVEQFVAEFM